MKAGRSVKKKFSRSEKLMIVLLAIALIAVMLKWQTVKQGFIHGWKAFSVEQWFTRE